MRNSISFLLLVLASQLLVAQPEKIQLSGSPLSYGISGLYYHPTLTSVNAQYTTMESQIGVPPGSDFRMYYLLLPTVRYVLPSMHEILVELGGSYGLWKQERRRSVYRIYLADVQGRYRLISTANPATSLFVSVGAGWYMVNFSRTYGNNVGISFLRDTWFAQVGPVLRVAFSPKFGLEGDVRYIFVPKLKFDNPAFDLKMSSLGAGLGFVFTL